MLALIGPGYSLLALVPWFFAFIGVGMAVGQERTFPLSVRSRASTGFAQRDFAGMRRFLSRRIISTIFVFLMIFAILAISFLLIFPGVRLIGFFWLLRFGGSRTTQPQELSLLGSNVSVNRFLVLDQEGVYQGSERHSLFSAIGLLCLATDYFPYLYDGGTQTSRCLR